MILMRANPLRVPLEGVGPEPFLGPEMATSEASALWEHWKRRVSGNNLISNSYYHKPTAKGKGG